LIEELAGRLDRRAETATTVRLLLDGPPAAHPVALAERIADALRQWGRPVAVIRADGFWRNAALRLEYGHQDVDAYADWLDAAALDREVLVPLGPGGTGRYLPSLIDPASNRATRVPALVAAAGTVVIVAGELLLGRGLAADVTIHLAVSAAARRRITPANLAWTLPAFDRYDDQVRPTAVADVVVRYDDPAHPAVAMRQEG
jgi:hypothetical protein